MSEMLWLIIVIHAIFMVIVVRLFWWHHDKTELQKISWNVRATKIPMDFFVFLSSNLGKSCHMIRHEDKSTIKGTVIH